jgi:hypothetical protein
MQVDANGTAEINAKTQVVEYIAWWILLPHEAVNALSEGIDTMTSVLDAGDFGMPETIGSLTPICGSGGISALTTCRQCRLCYVATAAQVQECT